MSFNVKHYVAIGLAVCAGYAMHKSTGSNRPIASETQVVEFKSLTNFEDAARKATPIAVIEPEPTYLDHPFSNRQQAIKNLSGRHRVEFDFGDTPTQSKVSVSRNVAGTEKQLTDLKLEDQVKIGIPPAAKTPINHGATSALANSENSNPAAQAIQHRVKTPDGNWKPTPSANQSIARTGQPTSVGPPTAQVPAVDFASAPSIIVEPVMANHDQDHRRIAGAKSQSHQPNLAPPMTENTTRIQARNDNLAEIGQSNQAQPAAGPGVAQAVNEYASYQADEVAPLQLRLTEAAAQQAVHHIEYGKTLSRRGAEFAARHEFFSALRVLAQANDATTKSNDFSRALSQAILAMTEAKDFLRADVAAEMLLDVVAITARHRSKIINKTQAKSTSPNQAIQKYFAFAKQKLDLAGGRNVVSAEAFYCLGKLHTAVSRTHAIPSRIDVAQAMAFHQAALMSDKRNYRSANELGVLMAQTGQLGKATDLFKQSLIAQPTPQTWKNLAKTHRRRGQRNLAQLAETEVEMTAQMSVPSSVSSIRWIPTSNFNERAPMEFHDDKRVAALPAESQWAKRTTNSENEQSKNEQPKDKTLGERLKELF